MRVQASCDTYPPCPVCKLSYPHEFTILDVQLDILAMNTKQEISLSPIEDNDTVVPSEMVPGQEENQKSTANDQLVHRRSD